MFQAELLLIIYEQKKSFLSSLSSMKITVSKDFVQWILQWDSSMYFTFSCHTFLFYNIHHFYVPQVISSS